MSAGPQTPPEPSVEQSQDSEDSAAESLGDKFVSGWSKGMCEFTGACDGPDDRSAECLRCRRDTVQNAAAPVRSDGYTSASTRSAHEAVMGAVHNLLD